MIAVWSFLAWAAARLLIVRSEMDHTDAIVVLSGSATLAERTEHAAKLFNAGHGSAIVLTNDNERGSWSQTEQRNPFYVESASERLQSLGVSPASIEIIWQPGSGTYDEALLVREYAQTHGLRSLLIVTSAYHSRRAFWTFRRVFEGSGIQLGISPVATGQQTPAPVNWWLHRRGWRMVPVEYLKMVYYRFRF